MFIFQARLSVYLCCQATSKFSRKKQKWKPEKPKYSFTISSRSSCKKRMWKSAVWGAKLYTKLGQSSREITWLVKCWLAEKVMATTKAYNIGKKRYEDQGKPSHSGTTLKRIKPRYCPRKKRLRKKKTQTITLLSNVVYMTLKSICVVKSFARSSTFIKHINIFRMKKSKFHVYCLIATGGRSTRFNLSPRHSTSYSGSLLGVSYAIS